MAGYCDHVEIAIRAEGSVSVRDNGRGFPVDIHPTEKIPGVEVAMTMLHAGGKFDHASYKVSGGLHGVGVSVVNALSEWLEVEVERNGNVYHQRYERASGNRPHGHRQGEETGTTVTFKPVTRRSSPARRSSGTRGPPRCGSSRSSTAASQSSSGRAGGTEETYFYRAASSSS